MKPPPGMFLPRKKCLKLLKNLYEMKQAPRNWYRNIVKCIKEIGILVNRRLTLLIELSH